LVGLINLFDIRLEDFKQSLLFLLELIMDNLSLQKAVKALKKLEFADESVTVIERLGKNGGKTSLLLLSALSELEEVVSELFLLNVHHIVVDEHELLNSLSELSLNSDDGLRHGFSLSVSNLDSLQLVELNDGLSQLHDVLAPFDEGI
jgi:hypothetical protein